MPDQRDSSMCSNNFKDAVCIDAGRVYDSCMDRDCLEDLRVFFSEESNEIIQNAISCRIKSAEVINVLIDVEPVTFNRGFFACDLTFFFKIKAEAIVPCDRTPNDINGICAFGKKVILCGSEGSVKVFSSMTELQDDDIQLPESSNLPLCKVQCVDPVVLDSKICDICGCCDPAILFPRSVTRVLGGQISTNGVKGLFVTLGLFSIVQLIRDVQMLVPVFDFCMPEKECVASNENPCDLFNKLKFPTEEFFPEACDNDRHCGC